MTKYTDRWFEINQEYDISEYTKESDMVSDAVQGVSEKTKTIKEKNPDAVIGFQDINYIIELCISAK
tara:strand:- start:498 stop:698 length:201 start_codon:yes stop_codon:yes gene_type:complete